MKPISRMAVRLGVGLLVCALIALANPLWMSRVHYNDVGPSPLAFLALFAWGLARGVPVLAVPVIIISIISLVRERPRRWGLLALALCVIACMPYLVLRADVAIQVLRGRETVANRVDQFGAAVRERLAPEFSRIGVAYPPDGMTFVGLKQERRLEVWVSEPPRLLKSYPMLGASGVLGPKLREGDRQVPEGLYRIESLNPNSSYHLALRVNYPNRFDRAKGKLDTRDDLGCDIMIHGKACSVGCLAMGDEAAEELFVLAAETGLDHIAVILSPVDFRTRELPAQMPDVPSWTPELYDSVRQELLKLIELER